MGNIVSIATIENEVEAQLLTSTLKEKGIPHLIKSHHDIIYNGIFQTQRGWGYISAPENYREEILNIIDDLRKEKASYRKEF